MVESGLKHPTGWGFDGVAVRAYRYGPNYPGLAGRALDPNELADLNRLYGLT